MADAETACRHLRNCLTFSQTTTTTWPVESYLWGWVVPQLNPFHMWYIKCEICFNINTYFKFHGKKIKEKLFFCFPYRKALQSLPVWRVVLRSTRSAPTRDYSCRKKWWDKHWLTKNFDNKHQMNWSLRRELKQSFIILNNTFLQINVL